MTIISSIYIATITPSILKHAMSGLVSSVNFHGPEDNPFGSTSNLLKHLSSLYLPFNNVTESSQLTSVLSPF